MESEKPEGLAVKRPRRESLAGWLWMSVGLVVNSSEVPICSKRVVMVRFDDLNTLRGCST